MVPTSSAVPGSTVHAALAELLDAQCDTSLVYPMLTAYMKSEQASLPADCLLTGMKNLGSIRNSRSYLTANVRER